jgi:putative N6-adenine-specific DNA methylase
METLFAVSSPGLHIFTREELRQIRLWLPEKEASAQPAKIPGVGSYDEGGGVVFEGDLQAIYSANLLLRTATRVLVRFGEFYAAAFSELEKKSTRLPWERYLVPGRPVAFRVTCHKSRLYHSDAVARTIVKAIGNRLGQLPALVKVDENNQDGKIQLIVARFVHDRCTINIDSSGASLHRRGYRLATAKAPLRETLAAGILMASGWDGISPLLDPFCGSGTIPIEAALLARNLPAGRSRRFTFMNWPDFDPVLWENVLSETKTRIQSQIGRITASDRDEGAITMAQDNADRAGVVDCIDFSCRSVSAIKPEGIGWVVTNPPYGVRVSPKSDLRNLYAQFGNVLRQRCPGWRVSVLCNDYQLLGNIGLQFDMSRSFVNGGIQVKLAQGVVV